MMLPTHSLSSGGGTAAPPARYPRLPVAAAEGTRHPPFLSSFCHRLGHLSLMDLQFSLAQFSLLLFAPRKVYAFAVLRKKQKNYYARDDPGFLLLLFLFSFLVGLAYGLAFSHSFWGCVLTAVAPSLYLLISAAVVAPFSYLLLQRHSSRSAGTPTFNMRSTAGRARTLSSCLSASNGDALCGADEQRQVSARRDLYAQQQLPAGYFPVRFFQSAKDLLPSRETLATSRGSAASGPRENGRPAVCREKTSACIASAAVPFVEIYFCFDVHWNASFVYMVVGLVLQLLLFPIFPLLPEFLACTLANSLQVAAAAGYVFITLLGYVSVLTDPRQLPPLSSLLPPLAVAASVVVLSASFFHINLAHALVKSLLLIETIASAPLSKTAGIAQTLLQQEAFSLFPANNSIYKSGSAPASSVDDTVSANSETVKAGTDTAAAAASSAATAVELVDAAQLDGLTKAKPTTTATSN